MGLRLADITGKAKLGQNKPPEQAKALMERLWLRGASTDARAISLMFQHHPEEARPARFQGPGGTWLWPWLSPREAPEAVSLLRNQYWTTRVPDGDLEMAQRGSAVWLGARDASGRLVATARAISDGVRHAYVSDVAVAPEHRGRGLGGALVRLLLDHPALRRVASIRLGTADAQRFYERLGFEPEQRVDFGFPMTSMLLRRTALAQEGASASQARASSR
jgi:GNAT superfamily N-acetyltransferase